MSATNILRCFDDFNFGSTYVSDNDFEKISAEELKVFMQQLSSVLIKDLDKQTQKNVLNVIKIMIMYHPVNAQNYMKLAFVSLGKVLITANSHVNGICGFGVSSLFGITLLVEILKSVKPDTNNDDVKNLLQFFILLPSGCFLSGRKKIILKCKEIVKRFLNSSPHFKTQIGLLIDNTECKPHFLAFVATVCESEKDLLRPETAINYTKLCFSDKHQIASDIIDNLGSLLKHAIPNRITFEEHLLPVMARVALRSPEKTLIVIRQVLRNLAHLDLSLCSDELIKALLQQLQSKNDSFRVLASDSLLAIISLVSSRESLDNILALLIALLIGTDKVAHLDTRLTIYNTLIAIPARVTLGNASASFSLADSMIIRLTAIKENQDSLIIVLIDSIAHWAQLNREKVSPAFVTWFAANGFNQRSSNIIKLAYYRCLHDVYDSNEKIVTLSIAPIQEAIERVTKMSLLLINNVHEVLPLAALLLRYSLHTDNNTDINHVLTLCGLKSSLTNNKLFADSSLLAANNLCLANILMVARHLLLHCYDTLAPLTEHVALIIRSIVVCALHNNYNVVRQRALATLTDVARSGHGPLIVDLVLDSLCTIDLTNPFWTVDAPNNDSYVDTPHHLAHLATQIISALLSLHSSGSAYPHVWSDPTSRIATMYRALDALNQRQLSEYYPHLWANHAQRLIGNTDSVLGIAHDDIIARFTATTHNLDHNDVAVLKCLCLNFSGTLIEDLLAAVIEVLDHDKFVSCSEQEVGVMNTRAGYLYNKTLLHSLPKYESNKSNIKRENKLYSYKDQMAGIEIKKELDDKRMKSSQENKSKVESDNLIEILSHQLTKNHKEQIANELAKESQIRYKMKELEQRVTMMTDIFRYISQWRKECFLKYFDDIIKVLQKLITKSPIGRMQASVLYNDLHCLTHLTRKQSIWGLRVLFFDSSLFSEEMKENWKYNTLGQELMNRLEILGHDELGEYSLLYIDQIQKKRYEFTTFLYLLPAICRLCDSVSDMENSKADDTREQWWLYLTWMDISQLMKILLIIKNQVSHGEVDMRQLFNSDLLKVLVKVTQNTDVHDVHKLIDEIVLKMMDMFNKEETNVDISNTSVFETVLGCFVSNTVEARLLALNCIDTVIGIEEENPKKLSTYICVAKHDVTEIVSSKASGIWTNFNLYVDETIAADLIEFIISPHEQVTQASIKALTELMEQFPTQLEPTMNHLFILYNELAYVKPPVCDDFGRVLIPSPADRWVSRLGIAKAFISLSVLIKDHAMIVEMFNFFIPTALNDRHQHVRASMLEAGQKVIECCGKAHISTLLPILENYLNTADNVAANDIVRQSVVILMGSLAKHLDASDERFNNIFAKLIEALNFPSADVQRSVSDTFDPLVKAFSEERQRIISDSLLHVLLYSKEEAERKGAAFGIAGIIKAVGITKLKTFKINDSLIEAIQNKGSDVQREIALFTFEQISAKMGRMFEPYVPLLLKYLLDSFADSSPRVRETACRTARMLMSSLSAPGVKIVLNPLLSGLDTNQWRTKAVSVELLGSMAYCAPRQLSNCLPTIVPKILSILSDSHPNVIKSARQALREIGSVIHNKEIVVIVPILIDALCDPINKTDEGLDCLISTKFVHQVDAASLAIIMSMVSRAFKERRSETKRKAAQIIGNLHSLIDDKDMEPYCASLLPGLKGCLVDPDPSVRDVASIALGTIAKVMEASSYEELMIWLMDALKDEGSGVNRSGAAQGLSEVLRQKGVVHLDKFMPDILENTRNTKLLAHVRDGYLMLYIYLPKRFQEQFAKYVKDILPSILQALSDEVEFIRETALNAGQGIIEIYSHIAIDTMLPNLESGMLDSNWRIRYSSIKLLGELLFRLIGISGKGTTVGGNEDESFAQSATQELIEKSLGSDKYRYVLAEIFLARMDVALQVRQSAVHIWKLLVVNTARCLKQIMPELMTLVLDCLSGEDNDNRIMATKSLGDVVKKLGERSLPEIFHDLETGFESCQPNHRIGVCNAILEILRACPKEQIVNYLDKVMPTFKSCLCDENPDVRKVAGDIFELLHSALGVKIVDTIIPDLVDKLDDPAESENALNGLCTLVYLKGRFVIPSLIPRLTFPTVNTKAFSELAKVAGDILSRHIVTVLPALLQAVSNVVDCANEAVEVDNCCQVIMAMDDQATMQIILKELITAIGNNAVVNTQIAGLKIMSSYMKSSADEDFIQTNRVLMNYIPIIIRSVVKLFAADEKPIVMAAFDCLADIITSLGGSNIEYVKDIRDSILVVVRDQSTKTGVTSEEVLIPAFCLEERSINPIIELYREALVNGRAELKEVAASGMEDCISSTETKVLAKAAVKISGPLIRTMSERHNAPTKSAIVSSLGKLIAKCPTQVKLFATQMQTIFIKCLSDPDQQLRLRSGIAQAKLAIIITKPDLFFNEMLTREFNEENQYKATGFEAVRIALESAGSRLTKDTLLAIIGQFQETMGDRDDQVRVSGSACLAVAMTFIKDEEFYEQLSSIIGKNVTVLSAHGLMVCLMVLTKMACARIFGGDQSHQSLINDIVKSVSEHCASDKVFIATAAYRVVGFIAQYLIGVDNTEPLGSMLSLLQNGMKQQSLEIKDVVVDVCGYLCWKDTNGNNVTIYAKTALAILINGYRAKESTLRIKSERRIMDLVRLSISLRRSLPARANDGEAEIDESVYRTCYDSLEQGTKTALAEVVNRFKRTYITGGASKETPTHCPELDNTYLKIASGE